MAQYLSVPSFHYLFCFKIWRDQSDLRIIIMQSRKRFLVPIEKANGYVIKNKKNAWPTFCVESKLLIDLSLFLSIDLFICLSSLSLIILTLFSIDWSFKLISSLNAGNLIMWTN